MKNLHTLPTDKPSRLHIGNNGNFVFGMIKTSIQSKNNDFTNQNIYITSDEEIKEGDWYINTFVSEREQKPQTHTEKRHLINHQKDYRFKYCKKIILTTDQDLIKDGVQAIDDKFLEWFVKNPSCEFVKIREKGNVHAIVKGRGIKSFKNGYKIVIPKSELASKLKEILDNMPQEEFNEEWKKITDLKMEGPSIIIPKEEQTKCYCGHTSYCDCGPEEPKQETLEEVKDLKRNNMKQTAVEFLIEKISLKEKTNETFLFPTIKNEFIEQAKELEKQQQGYSEEEVLEILYKHTEDLLAGKKVTLEEWFNKLKKK